MKNINIKTPPKWRKGQTIFNFLWWLQAEKGYPREMGQEGGRQADAFHISDTNLEMLYAEFLETWGKPVKK